MRTKLPKPATIRPQRPIQLSRAAFAVRTMRHTLGLTQQEFGARFKIPLGTLRDWEQGRRVPDRPVQAYLAVIAHDPLGVARALSVQPRESGGV